MKKIYRLFIVLIMGVLLTGCLKSEELDKAEIYTTTYPIQFLMDELYGYNSTIKSIYPEGSDINKYTLSNYKIKKYSKSDLFVYNGLTDDKQIAAKLVNKNSKLKIIDVSEGLAIKYSYEELWLNPSNYLMLAQNIKNNLKSYIESPLIKEEIDKNYDNFKVTITEFETTLKLLSQNANNNTIIVSKDLFKFLESYGLEVISLEENDELNSGTISRAKELLKENKNKYIFITKDEVDNYSDTIKDVLKSGGEAKVLNTITVLSNEEKNLNEDYISLMKTNIELLKEEAYK